MIYDVIIIGGGPSGMSAAIYALRSGKTVLVLEKENFGGQIANSPKVENYPTIESISGLELSDRMFTQMSDFGAEYDLAEVLGIEKQENGRFIVNTNYGPRESKTVIIANGVRHKKMNLPKEEDLIGKGISFCAVCDGSFYKGQEAYLIGDANTALQYALLLSNYCTKVNMFTLFDRFFGEKVLVDRVLAKENIIVTQNMNLIEYKGEKELTGLVFENTKDHVRREYSTNNVFIAIGQVPNNQRFANLVDLEKGYVLVDEHMMTRTPGVFAVGDTRKKDIRQVITACNDGAIAALYAVNMCD